MIDVANIATDNLEESQPISRISQTKGTKTAGRGMPRSFWLIGRRITLPSCRWSSDKKGSLVFEKFY